MMLGALGIALAVLAAQTTAAWKDPSPHKVRSITVDRSVHLKVLDWGGTGQPIVACYLTAHVYDDFAPRLGPFHVYGITRRGIGASVQPADGYDLQRSSDGVLEVLDALRCTSRFWLRTRAAAGCRRV
jgi:non-heme chloroperoxidase